MTNARPLVYRESLDEVAAQINGEKLTLRDMAFYVGYEEYQIQQVFTFTLILSLQEIL